MIKYLLLAALLLLAGCEGYEKYCEDDSDCMYYCQDDCINKEFYRQPDESFFVI